MNRFDIIFCINGKKDKITNYEEVISELNEKEEKLYSIKAKYRLDQSRFLEGLNKRKSEVHNVRQLTRIRAAERYSEGMNELLIGNEPQNVIRDIEDIIWKVDIEITSNSEKIQECKRNITNLSSEISDLKYRLKRLDEGEQL